MSARRSLVWLGLTPEPEQELPAAVAALRAVADGRPPTAVVTAERRRVERLVLRGTQRGWLRYLGEVTELVVEAAAGSGAGDPRPALVAGEVVLDHHRMLIGLPGSGYARTAPQRRDLERALVRLRSGLRIEPSDGAGPSDSSGPSGSSGSSGHGSSGSCGHGSSGSCGHGSSGLFGPSSQGPSGHGPLGPSGPSGHSPSGHGGPLGPSGPSGQGPSSRGPSGPSSTAGHSDPRSTA